MSWDQTYNDIYLLDLKTGKPKKVLEHWGNAATMSPGGKYVLHFDERAGHWLTYRVADGTRVNLTEKIPVQVPAGEQHARLARRIRDRRLDRRRQVGAPLRQVRHLGSETRRQRRAHGDGR